MSEAEKTWVIGIADDLETTRRAVESPAPMRPMARPMVRPIMRRSTVSHRSKHAVKARSGNRLHYAFLVALTYLLGPFALMLTERGRRSRMLCFYGAVAGLSGIALMVWRADLLANVQTGWGVTMLVMGTALIILAWFSIWARALLLTGQSDSVLQRVKRENFPLWLKKPWVLGGLGFLVPGLGLLLVGRIRRAVAVLWFCQLGVVAGLVLFHASWIWQANKTWKIGAISSNLLEVTFLLAGVGMLLGILGWIVQALEGSRQASSRGAGSVRPRGDRYAIALAASLAVFVLATDSVDIARKLDIQSSLLKESGCRVIPLYLSLAAHRCDPSQSRYAIQAMDLYAELGREDQAGHLRARLNENLGSYVELVRLENSSGEASEEILYTLVDPVSDPAPVPDESVRTQNQSQSEPAVEWTAQATYFGTMMIPDPQ